MQLKKYVNVNNKNMKYTTLILALFIFGCSKNDSELIKSNVFGDGTYTIDPNYLIEINYENFHTGAKLNLLDSICILDFGSMNINTAYASIGFSNKSNDSIQINFIGQINEPFIFDNSNLTMPPKGGTRIRLTFNPMSIGYYEQKIELRYLNTSKILIVKGTATSASGGGGGGSGTPILNYPAGGTLHFGDVYNGSSVTKTITISNTGTAVANWSNNRTDYTLNPPSGSINTGSTQNINVTYTATSTGTYNSHIVLSYNSTNLQIPFTVNRLTSTSGTRILNVTPSSTSFGLVPINTSQSKSVNISNSGTQPLNITSITMTGAAGVWSVDNYSGAIHPGASINVNVTFSPKSKINYNGTLTVNSDKTSGINTKGFMGSGN
jgi:hypothetical protein